MKEKIFVTQPFLPPLEDLLPYLKNIWESKWVTNNGKYHQELERALCSYMGVKHVSLFTNGTLALITSLQALRITGEVITTPYSFVATAHSLWWNGIKPVFVDIEPEYCTLNVDKIESAITPSTTAIMPVHIYGNPCAVEKIQKIADKHKLKVIYDAAHAFGVKRNNESILSAGDMSVLSFHATKTFNTFEGGAIVCHTDEMKQRIDLIKNFGIVDELKVEGPGINAKMNEFQAALGLLQLKHFDKVVKKLMDVHRMYQDLLGNVNGIRIMTTPKNVTSNFGYLTIFVDEKEYGMDRDALYEKLKKYNIFSRRYFYPLISQFPTYNCLPSATDSNLSVAMEMSQRVLCLPIYYGLELSAVEEICKIIRKK